MRVSSAEAQVYALPTGIAEGMVTKHLMSELGYRVTLVNHVDRQAAKEKASTCGFGKDEAHLAQVHVGARLRGERAH